MDDTPPDVPGQGVPYTTPQYVTQAHYTSTWFKAHEDTDTIQVGRAVAMGPDGSRTVTLGTTAAFLVVPIVVGVAMGRARAGGLISVAWSGTLKPEVTGLPAEAGIVTVAPDGSLEIGGTGPAIGYTNNDGELMLRLAGVSSLPITGVDGVDVNQASTSAVVRASRDVLELTLDTGNVYDDFTTTGFATSDILLCTCDGTEVGFTGFPAPGANDTRSRFIVNAIDSSGPLTLYHLTSSLAGNQIILPQAVTTLELHEGESLRLDYIDELTAWQVMSISRNVSGGSSYTGVDGVDVASDKVRASRDVLESTDLGNLNNYSPTGFDTLDTIFFTAPSLVILSGMAAPSEPDGTMVKLLVNSISSAVEVRLLHNSLLSSEANRLICPSGNHLYLEPGESALAHYLRSQARWYVTAVGKYFTPEGVSSHNELTGRDLDNNHLQYLLVDGTRDLGGNWSLGNYQLSNADGITFNGGGSFVNTLQEINFTGSGSSIASLDVLSLHDSGSYADFNGGYAVDLDTLTFNGIGSVLESVDNIDLDSASSTIDGAGGVSANFQYYEVNGSGSLTPPAGGAAARIKSYTGSESTGMGMLRIAAAGGLHEYPCHYDRQTGLSSGNTMTANLNLTDIDSFSFADGVCVLTAELWSWTATDSSYLEQYSMRKWFCKLNVISGNLTVLPVYLDDPNSSASTTSENFPYHEGVDVTGGDVTTATLSISATSSTNVTVTGTIAGNGTNRIGVLKIYVKGPAP